MVIQALLSDLALDWTTSESRFNYQRGQRVLFPVWEGQDKEICVKLQIISAGSNNSNNEILKQARKSTVPYKFNKFTVKFLRRLYMDIAPYKANKK
jgi:hypothetical protein